MKTTLAILFIASFAVWAQCGGFTPEEQALLDKGAVMKVRLLSQHSGHQIGIAHLPKGDVRVLMFVFGFEDAESARKAGRDMVARGYSPDDAVRRLLAEAQERYHGDKMFIKYYMDEAANAYNAGTK